MELARPESGGMAGESRPAGSGEAAEAHFSAEEALDATSQLLESGACPATRDRVVIDHCGLELRLSENSRAALHSYYNSNTAPNPASLCTARAGWIWMLTKRTKKLTVRSGAQECHSAVAVIAAADTVTVRAKAPPADTTRRTPRSGVLPFCCKRRRTSGTFWSTRRAPARLPSRSRTWPPARTSSPRSRWRTSPMACAATTAPRSESMQTTSSAPVPVFCSSAPPIAIANGANSVHNDLRHRHSDSEPWR